MATPSGDITDTPTQLHFVSALSRQLVTWNLAEGTLAQAIANGDDPEDIANAQQDAIANYKNSLGFIPFYTVDEFSDTGSSGVTVVSGTFQTMKYSAKAVIARWNYGSDVLVNFSGGSMPQGVYTWPTAVVSVKDVYHVTTTSDGGDTLPFAVEVWVGGENGVID